jgi:hypothetical protein
MIFTQMPLSLLFSCFALISAQSGDAVERRFSQLGETEQLEIVTELKDALLLSENVVLHRAAELMQLEYKEIEWQAVHRVYVFDHEQYAPKLKLKYNELRPSSSKWKKVGARSLPDGVPNEDGETRYDYATQSLVTHGVKSWGKALSALAEGSLDEISEFSSRCEGVLDGDGGMAKSADYFAHTYRDRNGYVYSGVRLFDIWNAETEIGISDVEGVAFLRNILDEHRIESPIDDRYHIKLYQRISEYFAKWREYQLLRETLALLQLNPNATIDIMYRGIRTNLVNAWIMLQFDPQRMADYLKLHPTRDEFTASIAKDLRAIIQPQLKLPLPDGYEANKLASDNCVTELQDLTNQVLRRNGLLGIRR